MRVTTLVTLLTCGSALVGCESEQTPAEPTPKVLVIGIDGIRPDILADVETPNLDLLATRGFFSDRAQTGVKTVSGPGWSSMLIGVWADKHGVLDNDFTTNAYDRYPDFLTRIEETAPELGTFVAADWLPLVDTTDGGPLISDRVDRKVVLDGYELGWAEADQAITDSAARILQHEDIDAAFVYLGNPDETSHREKSIGAPYREAIALADRQVGQLVRALGRRDGYQSEQWLILVSTDHGRLPDGDHGGDTPEERTIFYLAAGTHLDAEHMAADTTVPWIVDVAVSALSHLGISADGLDGRPVGVR